MSWHPSDIPSQDGRTVLITGANSGIGLEAARGLAEHGAHVILGCRNREKTEAAMVEIRRTAPHAVLEFLPLDLSRQASVKKAAEQVHQMHRKLDLLINNAGVMWLERNLTEDGFETHMATNHLGHFALTGLLIDLIKDVEGSRIVTVSSIAHHTGRISFADPTLGSRYSRHRSYSQSKVANLIFAKELQRHLDRAGARTISVACHPGVSNTNLATPGLIEQSPLKIGAAIQTLMPYMTQSAEKGAQPTLYAATFPSVKPGGYYGPTRLMEVMGPPGRARSSRYAEDPTVGRRLWDLSVDLTGVDYAGLSLG
jgi:protochlorophyllide reductase